MNGPLAALALVAAFALAGAAVWWVARRTGLGPWHPALAWLALEAVFFGIGAAVIANTEDRPGPALFVAGCVLAFGLAVAASHRFARRRTAAVPRPETGHDVAPIRPVVSALLAVLGIATIVPTILRVGIPFLAPDITGARTELVGLEVQLLRVALPAAAVGALLTLARRPDGPSWRRALGLIGGLLVFEVLLASRYLPAELLAALVIGWGLAGRPIPVRSALALGLVALVLFGGIGVVRAYTQAEGRELAFAVERTVNRIFLIQPRTLDALQATIPAEVDYYGGLTWIRRLGPLIGRDDIPNLGYWIYPRLFPDQTTPGYAAPGLVGEAWANLGPFGVLLFALFGVAVERFGALAARRRDGTADLVASALLVLFIARTHALGLDGLAVLGGLVTAWRLLAGPPAGLARDLAAVMRWRA